MRIVRGRSLKHRGIASKEQVVVGTSEIGQSATPLAAKVGRIAASNAQQAGMVASIQVPVDIRHATQLLGVFGWRVPGGIATPTVVGDLGCER